MLFRHVAGECSIFIGLCASLFMGELSNTFTLPGTETQRTLDRMKEELPDLSGWFEGPSCSAQKAWGLTAERKPGNTMPLPSPWTSWLCTPRLSKP